MASPKTSSSWQNMRRALSSKSKRELLNLVRDLYALNPANQDLVHTQALAPKTPPRRKRTTKPKRKSEASKAAPKIRRLAQMAAALQGGDSFEVTRLTTLKSLCEDSKAAAQFAVHLAKQTYRKMQEQKSPSHLDTEKWDNYKTWVAKALEQMEAYVEERSEQARTALWSVQAEVRGIQDTYENHRWGPVWIIQSSEVLLVEYALTCLLQPTASADWDTVSLANTLSATIRSIQEGSSLNPLRWWKTLRNSGVNTIWESRYKNGLVLRSAAWTPNDDNSIR
jgi:hypothetical protein